jgi:RNA polymerase sigma-70 factor (ECF subfamily)
VSAAEAGERISREAIARARAGEATATSELMCRLEAAAGRLLARQRRRSPMAKNLDWDDVRQTVMLRVIRHWPGFRGESGAELIAWLRRLVRNCVVDAMASESTRVGGRQVRNDAGEEIEASVIEDEGPGPVDLAARAEDRVAVASALAALGEPERRLIDLRLREGLSFREIALRLGHPSAAAAESAFRRCLRWMAVFILDSRRRGAR